MAQVKIKDNGRRTQINAAAGAFEFTYKFTIFEAKDIQVFLTPAGQTPNILADLLTLTTDYTVDGFNTEDGGKVTLVVPANVNDTITLQSNIIQTQLVDFKVGGQFAPATIDFTLDKLTILNQENNSLIETLGLTYATVDQLQPAPDFGDNALPVLPAQTGDTFPVWTKNTNNKLIAGVLKEEGGCSSLRGELADESVTTPGSQIVGYFNALDPPTGVSETVDAALNKLFQKLLPVTTHVLGDVKPSFSNIAATGWIRMNDDTIGNLASGATARANADTEDLFVLLWNNVSDAFAPVSGGRGATAIDDFNANKTLRFPLINGRVPGGSGTGAGLTARTLGEDVSLEEEHSLTLTEMPPHLHSLPFTGSENSADFGSDFTARVSGPTGISTGETGGVGPPPSTVAPHNNMQPTTFMNWYIRFFV